MLYSFAIGPGWIKQQSVPSLGYVWGFVANWVPVFHWPPGSTGILGHTWSLAIEEQYYWLWPLALVMLLRRYDRRRLAIGAFGAALVVATWRGLCFGLSIGRDQTYWRTDTHCDGLLLGSALALYLSARTFVPGRRWLPTAALSLCGANGTSRCTSPISRTLGLSPTPRSIGRQRRSLPLSWPGFLSDMSRRRFSE